LLGNQTYFDPRLLGRSGRICGQSMKDEEAVGVLDFGDITAV
jgi:hypothetical protein